MINLRVQLRNFFPNDKFIGNILTQFRKNNKLTEKDLARYFSLSHKTISQWENNNTIPNKLELIGMNLIMNEIQGDKVFINDI